MPDLSYTIRLDQIGSSGPVQTTLVANPSERAELCSRFDYVSLDALSSTVKIERLSKKGLFRVSGDLTAEIAQRCSVSLEPVDESISTAFTELFSEADAPDEDEITLDPDSDDAEPITDGAIDVGEVVAQQLALSANPYPRLHANDDGAEVTAFSDDDEVAAEDDDKSQNPFAVLAKIRDKTGNRN